MNNNTYFLVKNRFIYICVLISFFLFHCGFQEKIVPSWRNYLIWTADRGGENNTPDTQNNTLIFLSSAIAVVQVNFWTEDNFCCISYRGNLFNWKLKKLINEEIIIFYSPPDALFSSDESVHRTYFKYHTSIGICSFFTWFNLQILNFC